jgi:hypothetical protein
MVANINGTKLIRRHHGEGQGLVFLSTIFAFTPLNSDLRRNDPLRKFQEKLLT